MSEQLTRYIPEALGRESRDIVCECATCKEPIYAGQYTHQCDCCGRGNTCYCVAELPVIEGLTACAECAVDRAACRIPEVCRFCDEKGIRGEMIAMRTGGYSCELCAVIKAGCAVLASEGGRAA